MSVLSLAKPPDDIGIVTLNLRKPQSRKDTATSHLGWSFEDLQPFAPLKPHYFLSGQRLQKY